MKILFAAVVIAAGLGLALMIGDPSHELTPQNILAGLIGGAVTVLGLNLAGILGQP